jgi:hypothetical protein
VEPGLTQHRCVDRRDSAGKKKRIKNKRTDLHTFVFIERLKEMR